MPRRKTGAGTVKDKFAPDEVKNLWALSQLFYFHRARPWGEGESEFRIIFEPKEDVSVPQRVTALLFGGVSRIIYQGIAWPVKRILEAGTAQVCAPSVRGKAIATFAVDDSTLAPTDYGEGVLILEEADGREHRFFKKGAL